MTLDDAGGLEFLQPLREQRRGHQRHAPPQLVEPPAAGNQFAQYQGRPPFRDDLGGLRDWAELPVSRCALPCSTYSTGASDFELSGWIAIEHTGLERNTSRRLEMTDRFALDWPQTLAELGPVFAERAAASDESDGFIAENYAEMREARLFSALVPEELGGGGLSYSEVCSLIRGLAAAAVRRR
jgi:hypothetical protein